MNRLAALLPALAIAFAQNPAANRVDAALIQVDAVVTDSSGGRVADLQPADFEVLQDGKPQAITNFSYVSAGRGTLALVVDDLRLAAADFPPVSNAIRHFLDEQMRPGDVAAIIRTGAGLGALQQFTTDKSLLYAALDLVKYGESPAAASSFALLGRNPSGHDTPAGGTVGAIRFAVNAMAGLPGRKAIVVFTGNLFAGAMDEMAASEVQRLSDAACRASVVIHAIDLMPATDPRGISARQGRFALADATGGLFLHGVKDLAGALRKAAEDGDGYYLIGYHPDADTLENRSGPPKFHKIEVNVNRAGFAVRSRNGFFGEPDGGTQIHPRLTAVFSNLPETGSSINALLSFDPKDLKWSTGPGGSHKARMDVAAAAYDEDGFAVAPVDTTLALQLTSQDYDEAMKGGMVYGIHVPIAKPGRYMVRAAVRDAATEVTGSADRYVEVPDVAGGRLALTGLVLQEATYAALYSIVPFIQANADLPQVPAPRPDVTGGAARRSFRRGTLLAYGFKIVNATNGPEQLPELEVETTMFHDGKPVLTGKIAMDPRGAQGAPDPRRLMTGGRLVLGRNMEPGEYVLQVVVTDRLAKSDRNTATQSMDFEIEP